MHQVGTPTLNRGGLTVGEGESLFISPARALERASEWPSPRQEYPETHSKATQACADNAPRIVEVARQWIRIHEV